MTDLPLSRRAVTRALLAAPAALTVISATGASATLNPAAEYLAVEKVLNEGRATEKQFLNSLLRMDQWQPANPEEFLFKFCAMCGDQPEYDGMPTGYRMLLLAQQAQRI